MAEEKTVATKTAAVNSMAEAWDRVDALMGGTTAMREAGAKYLPKWPMEEDKMWASRLATSTLYPAYSQTVVSLAAKPFSRPIAFSDDMPEVVEDEWMANVDRQGRNVHAFASEVIEVAIAYGMSHILVDYPVVKTGLTVSQEKALKVRPYMVMVKPTRLIGWRATPDGTLTQVRFFEEVNEEDGEFSEKKVEQVRVLYIGKWEVWRKKKVDGQPGEQWVVHAAGITTLDKIPFITVYGRRIGFMLSKPPMNELAHMNIKHWQSQSDQDNIMHVARVPILAVAGVDDSFNLVVGAGAAVKLPTQATMQFVEHSGAAIGAGKVSLDDLKEEMRQTGSEMLVLKPGGVTATQIATESSSSMSDLQHIVQNAEDSIDLALECMGELGKVKPPGTVTLYNDFGALAAASESGPVILQAATAGIISKETAFDEMQRRGFISPDVDWEEEQQRIADEGPPVGNIDPVTGLPHTKPLPPADPNAPKGKIDPLTGLPYDKPVPPTPKV